MQSSNVLNLNFEEGAGSVRMRGRMKVATVYNIFERVHCAIFV